MNCLADPLDDHFRLVQQHDAVERMVRAVAYLDAIGCAYVVEGGWAVSAYGSPVESVDLDLVMSTEDVEALHAGLLEVAGIQAREDRPRLLARLAGCGARPIISKKC